mgnify:CR=1 FL=1
MTFIWTKNCPKLFFPVNVINIILVIFCIDRGRKFPYNEIQLKMQKMLSIKFNSWKKQILSFKNIVNARREKNANFYSILRYSDFYKAFNIQWKNSPLCWEYWCELFFSFPLIWWLWIFWNKPVFFHIIHKKSLFRCMSNYLKRHML